jgi:hypothetical protein
VITFHEENCDSFFRDGAELFPVHYEELALNKDKVKLDFDTQRYYDSEKTGILHIAGLRDDGKLVGYYVSVILRHLHYVSLICSSTDLYWVKPEYRTRFGGAFIRFFEHCWKKRGVQKAYISCKVHQDKTKFLEALGYTKSDFMFVRML